MKKLSRGAYEDTKGFLRVAETLLEVLILTVIYYLVWKQGYEMSAFAYKGKYVLMGVYGLLTYLIFQNADCTMFGQLSRIDLIIGQIISLFLVNFITYLQLCLIGNAVLMPAPMVKLFIIQTVVAILLILVYTTVYHKLYAPHNMLLIFGNKNSIGLKFKMDSRKDKYNITGLISADEGYDAIVQKIRMNMENNYKDAAQMNLKELEELLGQLEAKGKLNAKQKAYYTGEVETFKSRMKGFTHKDQKPTWV